jgi:hypothetical protein
MQQEEMKFYIEKRAEWEGDGFKKIMKFETIADLERFLSYNRAYIVVMKTLDIDECYSFEDSKGVRVQDDPADFGDRFLIPGRK